MNTSPAGTTRSATRERIARLPWCIDQMSRRVVGFALFKKAPTSPEICRFIDRAINGVGTQPQHIVTDKDSQFFCKAYEAWCRRRSIHQRFGAVGKHASIPIAERFIRSMKSKCTRRLLVPMRIDEMRAELCYYANWYTTTAPINHCTEGLQPRSTWVRRTKPCRSNPDRCGRFERSPCVRSVLIWLSSSSKVGDTCRSSS
jgi:transposase InsO family protein